MSTELGSEVAAEQGHGSEPDILSRVWSDDGVIADNLHGAEIAARLKADDQVSAWGVVSRTDEGQIGRLVEEFGLDSAVLADLTTQDPR